MTWFEMVMVPTGPTVSAKAVVTHTRREPNSSLSNILSLDQPSSLLLIRGDETTSNGEGGQGLKDVEN